MDADTWVQLEIRDTNGEVFVSAADVTGDRVPALSLGPGSAARLAAMSAAVAKAVAQRAALGKPSLADLSALHGAIFVGKVRDLLMRAHGAAKGRRVLLRLAIEGRSLARFPWEALCDPETGAGYLGTSAEIALVRSVAAPDPVARFNVRGALRILAIAPGRDADALHAMETALAPRVETGEIEVMPPILGAAAKPRVIFDRLRMDRSPHVIHFLGHGGFDENGDAVLRFADRDAEPSLVKAELLAQELRASIEQQHADALRLVVLDACEGAAPGDRPSAAELFVKAGAVAAVAHAYPVDDAVARDTSRELYFALAQGGAYQGDVAASLNAARRTMLSELGGSAEAFSSVLHLRGPSARVFDFEGRRLTAPRPTAAGQRAMAPALRRILGGPFTLLLGDVGYAHQVGADELRTQVEGDFEEDGRPVTPGLPLSVLTERHALRFGPGVLDKRSAEVLRKIQPPMPPGIAALARLLPPGVHSTLLWLPLLERAVAEAHPDRTVYAVQPDTREPFVVRRLAGKGEWRVPLKLPKTLDLKTEIVVLRLYGGHAANDGDTSPLLTEDEHFQGLLAFERSLPAEWADLILGSLREPLRPALIIGISVLQEWRHRMLLHCLFRGKPMTGSVAVLPESADPDEQEIWEAGERLPIEGSVPVVRGGPEELAPAIASIPPSRPP